VVRMADTNREAIRQMLARRYHGAVDITDEMIDAVLSQTWTTEELQRDFEVIGFSAPFVVVQAQAGRQDRHAGVHPSPARLLRVRGGNLMHR
jgi:hypothetical protein